ncbi:MAG: hypothetical protein HC896_09445 [Bacteroidales bacterium]|nr:hypothetical protein [Bacteroidales bacterium]
MGTPYNMVGLAGTNHGVAEISNMPPVNLESRLKYLVQYPHGCIEQTTSSVFPQLYLPNLVELPSDKKNELENNIKAGIQRLVTFQLGNGGLSYWPGYADGASHWGTNYAGHFMLEAKNKGYTIPQDFLKLWIRFQTNEANHWRNTNLATYNHHYNSNQLTQAYRLYTLALAGKPAMGAMNRMRQLSNLAVAASWRLAAAYALAGKTDVAAEMVKPQKPR